MSYRIFSLIVMAGLIAEPGVAQAPASADAHCRNQATQATGSYGPGTTPPAPTGNRVRGAARGAAVGAITGNAGRGAAVGTVVGGSRNRQERRANRRAGDAWQNSYNACMSAGG